MNACGWATALIAFLLASDPVHEGISKETITVRVVHAGHGKPLEGVEVHVEPKYPDWDDPPPSQKVVTAKDGRATVTLEQRHITRWRFRKTGHLVAILDGDDVKNGTVVRLKAAPPLAGRVVRFGDGKAIPNARVHQWIEGWGLEPIDRMLVTGADGGFLVPGLPPEKTVRFGIAAEGYVSAVVDCPPDERAAPLIVTLGKGGTISGRVLDRGGKPLAAADVYLAERGGDDPLREAAHVGDRYAWLVGALRNHATSGPDGTYRFVGVPARAPYLVFARHADGREGRTGPLILRSPGDRLTAEVRVRPLARITLRLFDSETEEEVDALGFNATIDGRQGDAVRGEGAGFDPKSRRRFFADVRAGTHVVYLSPKHHVKMRVAVTVTPGEQKELRVLVDRGTFLKGRLVSTKGKPLSGHIRLYWMDGGEEEYRSGMAGKDGTFELRGIPEGEARFVAWPSFGREGEWKITTGRDLGDLVLQPGLQIVGRLAGVEGGERAEIGIVYASGGGNSMRFNFAADGKFETKRIAPGSEFAVYVGLRGRAPFVKRGLTIKAGQTIDLGEVRLPEPSTVRGTVVDPSGKPVPHARVRVAEYWYDGHATTDASGGFVLKEMPPGPSLLVVEVRETPLAYVPVDATPDAEPVTLKIETPGTIVARVRERDGSPVIRFPFNLFVRRPDGEIDWLRRVIVRTDARGEIRVPAIPGRWFLEPHPNRRRELTTACPPIEVTSGNEVKVTLTLK